MPTLQVPLDLQICSQGPVTPQPPVLPHADQHMLGGRLSHFHCAALFQNACEKLQDVCSGLSPGAKHLPQAHNGSAGHRDSYVMDPGTMFLGLV